MKAFFTLLSILALINGFATAKVATFRAFELNLFRLRNPLPHSLRSQNLLFLHFSVKLEDSDGFFNCATIEDLDDTSSRVCDNPYTHIK